VKNSYFPSLHIVVPKSAQLLAQNVRALIRAFDYRNFGAQNVILFKKNL